MRAIRTGVGVAFVALVMARGSVIAAPSNPAPTVAELLDRTPGASGLFVATNEGSARHVQSGLVCPAAFPSVNLWHLQIYSALGADVGCDYGRNGTNNRAVVKLTIYAVKAQPGDTTDAAFLRYKDEITAHYPEARNLGPAFVADATTPELLATRSASYALTFDTHPAVSNLVVAIKAGWIIEIRSTIITDPAVGGLPAPSSDDARLTLEATTQAVTTIRDANTT